MERSAGEEARIGVSLRAPRLLVIATDRLEGHELIGELRRHLEGGESAEVMVIAHAGDQARWFEDGLFERAQEALHPPLHMVTVRREGDEGEPHLAGVQDSGPGRRPRRGAERELTLSPNLPGVTPGDLTGVLIAIAGTIVAIVLAATGPGSDSPGGAAQILIAMAVALINMAHVVGLTLLESVGHRGGWQRFFRNLSITATPLAIAANALISILA